MTADPDRLRHSADTYPRWAGAAYYTPVSDGAALGWERQLPEGITGRVVLRVADNDSITLEHIGPDGTVEVLFVWRPT